MCCMHHAGGIKAGTRAEDENVEDDVGQQVVQSVGTLQVCVLRRIEPAASLWVLACKACVCQGYAKA